MRTADRLVIAAPVIALLAACASAQTVTCKTLYSFQSDQHYDGAQPYAGLLAGANATLYGTTVFGGLHGAGTVFELKPPGAAGGAWTERVLYNFAGGIDGANPYGGLVFDAAGALYGTTAAGGTANAGTIFKLRPPAHPNQGNWSEAILHYFGASGDGIDPQAGLVLGPNGEMYGTTYYGGTEQPYSNCIGGACGTVFELVPPGATGKTWKETVLYTFPPEGGISGNPAAGVVIGPGGALFGTSLHTGGFGTVFELSPPGTAGGDWTETTLHTFGTTHDSSELPYGSLVFSSDGALYGTASTGVVFRLEPPAWTYSSYVLASGTEPYAGLVVRANGALFGTTVFGGASGMGTVFELIPPTTPGAAWKETVLHNFTGQNGDGAEPYAGLTLGANGVLYGTTAGGGTRRWGTVFALTP